MSFTFKTLKLKIDGKSLAVLALAATLLMHPHPAELAGVLLTLLGGAADR